MKNKLLLLFFFFLFSFGIVRATTLPLLGKVIYIDPGHGGKDPGAISGGINESIINLEIGFKLQEILEKNGAIVYMTRYGDYDLSSNNALLRKRSDLSRRANIINESKADIYISIHLNADISSTWKGAQVFYSDVNIENEKLAKILQEQFTSDLKTNRKYKKINDHYMYKRINVKGVLAEVGFLTNPNERYLLQQQSYQYEIAKSISKGIIKYYENN